MIAVIPARSGSKGVKNKNIRLVGDKHLLAYSIIAARMIPEVERVIVSTDSKEYADISKNYGAEVPFLRPSIISSDKSTDFEVFKHAIDWLKENEKKIPELLIHFRPTTPLREPKILKDAIKFFKKNINIASSLRSGHLAPESPFKWFMKDENNFFKPLKGTLTPQSVNLPRQTFPNVYIPNGYIDIIKSSTVIEDNTLHGSKMLVFETPFSAEVDTEDDFKFLKYYLEQNRSIYNNLY